jgi:hypothetical protein
MSSSANALRRPQQIGIALTLAGVCAIAAG